MDKKHQCRKLMFDSNYEIKDPGKSKKDRSKGSLVLVHKIKNVRQKKKPDRSPVKLKRSLSSNFGELHPIRKRSKQDISARSEIVETFSQPAIACDLQSPPSTFVPSTSALAVADIVSRSVLASAATPNKEESLKVRFTISPVKSPRKTPSALSLKSPQKRCTPLKSPRKQRTPSKGSPSPFLGVKHRLAPPLRVRRLQLVSDGQYFQSPEKALVRPLKQSCPREAIRRLSAVTPEKSRDLEAACHSDEEQDEPWPDEIQTNCNENAQNNDQVATSSKTTEVGTKLTKWKWNAKRATSKKSSENFVRIDLKHKKFTRGAKKLTGAALKRMLFKKQQRANIRR